MNTISRRQFLRILAIGGITGAGVKIGLDRFSAVETISETRLLMGTVVNLRVVSSDRDAAQRAVWACFDQMEALERLLSRFQPQSQLSMLNNDGQLADADPHLLGLLAQSRQISELSNSAFDITIKPLVDLYQGYAAESTLPGEDQVESTRQLVDYSNVKVSGSHVSLAKAGMSITLDGIAKGYIVDQGVLALREHGFADVLVEAGGDMLASGNQDHPQGWQVGVQSPRTEDTLARFSVQNQAVATSGDYMRSFTEDLSQHHILDPRTGYSSPGLASATILAPTATLADGLATAVMVLGPEQGIDLLESLAECEGYLVSKSAEIIRTSNLIF